MYQILSLPQPQGINDSSERDSSAAGVLHSPFRVHCLPGGTATQKRLTAASAEKGETSCPRTPPSLHLTKLDKGFQPS